MPDSAVGHPWSILYQKKREFDTAVTGIYPLLVIDALLISLLVSIKLDSNSLPMILMRGWPVLYNIAF